MSCTHNTRQNPYIHTHAVHTKNTATSTQIMTSYSWQLYQKEKKGFIQYISEQNKQADIILSSGGVPDMRYVQNKSVFAEYLKFKNKSGSKVEKTSKSQKCQQDIQQYDCAICMESINDNICLLKCKHSFCVSCYSIHIRVKNTCPLCRAEICCKPKSMKKIPDSTVTSIMIEELAKKYDERQKQTLEEYIRFHVPNCLSGRMVMSEIKQTILDVAFGVADYYDSLY